MNGFFFGLAAAIFLWSFSFLYLKYFIRRRTSPDHILSLLQEEVRQLEADIDEKTERDLQLLEEKIRALREICAEAERRILIYGQELEKREKETQTIAAIHTPPLVERIEVAPELKIYNKPLLIKKPPIKDRILELQRAGFSAELIAKRLGLKLGEVNLYFNLTEKQ